MTQLESVQRRAAGFVNKDYRRKDSVSQLVAQLGWESLSDRRMNARLSLLYKGLHGLAAVPVDQLQRSTRCTRYSGTDTFITLPSRIDCYKYSFLPRTVVDWNALPEHVRTKPSADSFRAATHSLSCHVTIAKLLSHDTPAVTGCIAHCWICTEEPKNQTSSG